MSGSEQSSFKWPALDDLYDNFEQNKKYLEEFDDTTQKLHSELKCLIDNATTVPNVYDEKILDNKEESKSEDDMNATLEIPSEVKQFCKTTSTRLTEAALALRIETAEMVKLRRILQWLVDETKVEKRMLLEKMGTLTQLQFVETDKKNVSLLLIGESGAGKTTLRFAIRDYEEDESYKQDGAERPKDGSAQTLDCVSTHIENDERGTQDQKNWENISSNIDGLEFNAIVIVLKGNTNRLHKGMSEELSKLHQRLHEECKKNTFVLFSSAMSAPGEETLRLMEQLQ
ncbi:hypothetical protein RFI_27997, partial [Reticulomyxa filosa]